MTGLRRSEFFSIPRPPIRSVPMLLALTFAWPTFQATRTFNTTIERHKVEAQELANVVAAPITGTPAAATATADAEAVTAQLSSDAMGRAFSSLERLAGPHPAVIKVVVDGTGRATAEIKVDRRNIRSVFSDDAAHERSVVSSSVPAEADVRWSMLDPAAPSRMVAAAASLGVPASALQTLTFGPYDQQGAPGFGWRGIWTATPQPLVITGGLDAKRPVREP